MLMGTNTVSSTDTTSKYASVLGTTAKETRSTSEESQDRFLKLFVAQLNNQDPMNPMDNAQMTTQMAQINTVSGIEKLNDTVKSLTTQFSSMQLLQSATMVGREVLSTGNTLTINNSVGKGALTLEGSADKVSVQVLTPGGQLLGTVEMGAKAAGQHTFQWDASTYSASTPPVFKVTATQGGKAVTSASLTRDTVQSVGTDASGALNLTLNSGKSLAYNAIKAVL
jgi:flagellar basal-body rod modification protein FlgD